MSDGVEFGRFQVFPERRELWTDGRPVTIGARALDVLITLIGRAGELVTKDELLAAVWAGAAVEDGAIAAQIAAVRRALGDGLDGARWVQTVPGRGYRFVGRLAPTARGKSTGLWRWLRARPRILTTVIVAGLVMAGGALWLARDRLQIAPRTSQIPVAVLPFDAVSPGQDAQLFAAGLFDELLGALSSNQVLVVSRPDTPALRGPAARQAMDSLGVRLLLDGTVQSDGRTLRVRVHLDDVRRHVILWSRQFEGPVHGSEFLSADVAAHTTDVVVSAVSTRYGLDASGLDAPTMAAFLEAPDEMQNGGDRFVEIYRRVVAAAPNWSYGHSGLAFALMNTASPEAAAFQARRALALDPRNGEGYVVLANVAPETAWREREALLLRGLEIDPEPPYLPDAYARFLSEVGRCRDALAMTERATRAEPFWNYAGSWLPIRLLDAGQVEPAREAMSLAVRRWPSYPIANILFAYLTFTEAPPPQALRLLDGPNPAPFLWTPASIATWRRFVRARDSHDATARVAAAQAVNRAAEAGDFTRHDALIALSMLGDIDGALANAERYISAEDLRRPGVPDRTDTQVLFTRATIALRRDPRFMQLAARVGLVDYWRQSGRWPDFCNEPGWPYDCRVEAKRRGSSTAG
jgi:DNA-binding winged helix-turn-helix (wHTH) protein/TolB-like protein/Tfp pilus assembly protein PilF